MAAKSGRIYSGTGGWTFAPWRGVFYPKGLPHAQELAYAAQRLTSIEVNGTFYRTQSAASYRKWASEVPDGFIFSLKGPRFAVNRRVLAEAGDSIKRFLHSGPLELGDRLGPLLWQFAPTKKFEEADFGKFLELLPATFDGRPMRHVVEVRHDSFRSPAFIALLRQFAIPVVFAEHATYPAIADLTGDFVYARLQKGQEKLKAGYPPKALDEWAARAATWASGGAPADLPYVGADLKSKAKKQPRDVFMFFIHEAKVRAPAAAMALIERVGIELEMQAINPFSTAKGYVQSAYLMMSNPDRYQTPDDSTFYLSFHMLCGFATELYLKSYLSHKGVDERALRRIGHNLEKLLETASSHGFLDDGAAALVEFLCGHHESLEFRYTKPNTTYRTPNLDVIFDLFSSLNNAVDLAVGASAAHGLGVGGRWTFPQVYAHWRT